MVSAAFLAVVPARAAEPGDWEVFGRLADAVASLLTVGDPIAETVNRLKFRRFLRAVENSVAEIADSKFTVLEMLQLPTCSSDPGDRIMAARAAALRIIPLVDQLAAHVRTFATAVRPSGTREDIVRIAEDFRSMQHRKMWVYRIDTYCAETPEGRFAFRKEVAGSYDLVRRSQRSIGLLLERL